MEDRQPPDVVVLTLSGRERVVLLFRDGSRVRLRCFGFRPDGVSLWTEMPCVDPHGRISFLSEVEVEDLRLGDLESGISFDMGEHGTIRVEVGATTPVSATLVFEVDRGCALITR